MNWSSILVKSCVSHDANRLLLACGRSGNRTQDSLTIWGNGPYYNMNRSVCVCVSCRRRELFAPCSLSVHAGRPGHRPGPEENSPQCFKGHRHRSVQSSIPGRAASVSGVHPDWTPLHHHGTWGGGCGPFLIQIVYFKACLTNFKKKNWIMGHHIHVVTFLTPLHVHLKLNNLTNDLTTFTYFTHEAVDCYNSDPSWVSTGRTVLKIRDYCSFLNDWWCTDFNTNTDANLGTCSQT